VSVGAVFGLVGYYIHFCHCVMYVGSHLYIPLVFGRGVICSPPWLNLWCRPEALLRVYTRPVL
jgi:hypothetical protein